MGNTVNSYIDKYKSTDPARLSLYEILQKVGTREYINSTTTREYEAIGIDYVTIDGNKFTNYGQYSFILEKTYVTSPERSAGGTISNLNAQATFVVPHLIMDFSIMSIDDYRKIMSLHYSANEFVVECYDPIYNTTRTAKMYFATEEMAKLYTISQNRLLPNGQWEEWVDLVGVTDYKVELIGTNNDINFISVTYNLNPPSDTGYSNQTEGENDIFAGEEIIIGAASTFSQETFNNRYRFKEWQDIEGRRYLNGFAYSFQYSTQLYAIWETAETRNLTFNYGLAYDITSEAQEENFTTIRNVANGKPIGNLPEFYNPMVKYEDKTYYPYYDGKWYKTPIIPENPTAAIVQENENYWTNRDSTIYLLFKRSKYDLLLKINGQDYQSQLVEYGAELVLPNPIMQGYTFDGWYTTPNYQDGTKFNGKMTPCALTLYGRWLSND